MHVATHEPDWQELATQLGAARGDLLRYCVGLVHDRSEAEDLVQQVFLATLTRTGLDLTRPLLPWMRRVAKHRAVDRYRSQRREQEPLSSQIPDSDTRNQHQTTETARGAAGAWMAVVGSLRPQQRAVLLLRDLLDFSGAETAEAVGISEGNVKVLLHRARAALADATARDPSTTRTTYARAAGALLSGSPGDVRYEPRRLFDAQATNTDLRMESKAAWSLWGSLLDAMERSAPERSPMLLRVLLARIIARRGDETLAHHTEIEAAHRLADRLGDPHLLADVDLVAGVSHMHAGRHHQARECFDRILDSPAVGTSVKGYAATGVAGVHWRSGRFDEARKAYERAAALVDSPQKRDALLHNVALLDALSGELESALRRGEEALANHLAAGRGEDAYETLTAIGMALQNHNRLDDAQERFDRALALRTELSLPASDGPPVINLGLIAHERGDFERAEALFEHARSGAVRTGRIRRQAIALANLGVSRHARGELVGALAALDAAAPLAESASNPHLQGFVLAHRAAVHAARLEPQARADLEQARQLLTEVGEPRMLEVLAALEPVVGLFLEPDTRVAAQVARARMHQLERPSASVAGQPDSPAPTTRYAAVRIAVGLLRRALRDLD